jgi:hypothetical protein
MMRYSEAGSHATISSALRRFEQMKLLRVIRDRAAGAVCGLNRYQFTFGDQRFLGMVDRVVRRQRAEIAFERELRTEKKKARRKSSVPVKVNTLFTD